MPLTPCLSGPAFSIVGDSYFSDNSVNFQVSFDSPAAQESVLAYQWYLDESLVTEQQAATFNDKISCGDHSLGLRILNNEGWSGIKRVQFTTCKLPTSIILNGPAALNESSTGRFYVFQLFSDGSNEDISSGYTFTCDNGGVFDGNLFKTSNNSAGYDDIDVVITASKTGGATLTKLVTILNTTPVTLISLAITGPATVANGGTAAYGVLGSYSDGSQRDISADFTFASTEGYFAGRSYTAFIDRHITEAREVTISALQNGFVKVSRQIEVSGKVQAGVLIVDFLINPTLNLIGLIGNTEVVGHDVVAYAGNNIVPAGELAENALILSSDAYKPADGVTWAFTFNLEKLISEYPETSDFTFGIKGRSANLTTLGGVYRLRDQNAKMILGGTPGTYMPGVVGGKDIIPHTVFTNTVLGGANGDHDIDYLQTIVNFNYNVPTASITHSLPPPSIKINDFDFMAVSYQWEEGAGADLDMLVGFENTGTQYDEVYVGYGQGNATVPVNASPANAYLQSGTDNTGTNGYEGALIGMKAFQNAFPNLPDVVEVGLYAVWYSTPVTGDFKVKLVTYKGGSMMHSGTDFINSGGAVVSSDLLSFSTMKTAPNSTLTSDYYKIGTLRYNKITASATIEIL